MLDLYFRFPIVIDSKELRRTCEMCQSKKKAEYECCGKTFETKEELEAHKKKYHKKSGCCK